MKPRVLVVEDGHEYSDTLGRYLAAEFEFVRAGSGPQALDALKSSFDAVFLDMRFDRTPSDELLGDLESTRSRFNGDADKARRFLEDNQGTYVLAALRGAGHTLTVVMSYDFDSEPRRFRNLERLYAPIRYLTDNADPQEIRDALQAAAG